MRKIDLNSAIQFLITLKCKNANLVYLQFFLIICYGRSIQNAPPVLHAVIFSLFPCNILHAQAKNKWYQTLLPVNAVLIESILVPTVPETVLIISNNTTQDVHVQCQVH